MSGVLATTRLAVYRGTTETAVGDEVDDNFTPIEVFTDWAEQFRNATPNPTFDASQPLGLSPGNYGTGGGGAASMVDGATPDGLGRGYRKQWTIGPASLSGISIDFGGVAANLLGSSPLPPDVPYCASVWFQAPYAGSWRYVTVPRLAGGGTITSPAGPPVTALAAGEWIRLYYSGTSPANSAFHRGSLNMIAGAVPTAGTAFVIARPMLDVGTLALRDYVDGSQVNTPTRRTSWAGAPFASTSILETRESLGTLMTEQPASVIQRSKRVQDPATGTWRSIPYYRARLTDPSLDIRRGDRVRDLRTGKLMTVDSVDRVARSLTGSARLSLDLTDRASA